MESQQINEPSPTASPQGRRIVIAVVTGEAGARIQRWREEHDPVQARRLPAHATLCYWAPEFGPAAFERQLRHAFGPAALRVRLGAVRAFDGAERGLYVPVLDTAAMDSARRRLYDGTHVALGDAGRWPWHITCVRNAPAGELAALYRAAAALDGLPDWDIAQVSYLELRGDRYEPIATWSLME